VLENSFSIRFLLTARKWDFSGERRREMVDGTVWRTAVVKKEAPDSCELEASFFVL